MKEAGDDKSPERAGTIVYTKYAMAAMVPSIDVNQAGRILKAEYIQRIGSPCSASGSNESFSLRMQRGCKPEACRTF